MHDFCRAVRSPIGRTNGGIGSLLLAGAASLALSAPAEALTITPVFGTGTNASVDAAINSAIGTIDGLYSNPVNITVTFTNTPGAAGNLLSTNQTEYGYTYSSYKAALTADSTANPGNTVLATAVANLASGNNANGAAPMLITGAQSQLLALYGLTPNASDATININSNVNFATSRPVSSSQFDLIGGLEHELDEVLGGGGAGSTLNIINSSCGGSSGPTFPCNTFGSLDLYRYSAPGVPSFTTSGSASSYLSFNGGVTKLVAFNQNSGGDYGDFSPPGTGAGQLIQNAFNDMGQDEDYTTSSPEFAMMESIGWAPTAQIVATPEPGTLALLGTSMLGFAALRRRRRI